MSSTSKLTGGVLCASGELEPFNDWNDGTIADDRWHDLGSF